MEATIDSIKLSHKNIIGHVSSAKCAAKELIDSTRVYQRYFPENVDFMPVQNQLENFISYLNHIYDIYECSDYSQLAKWLIDERQKINNLQSGVHMFAIGRGKNVRQLDARWNQSGLLLSEHMKIILAQDSFDLLCQIALTTGDKKMSPQEWQQVRDVEIPKINDSIEQFRIERYDGWYFISEEQLNNIFLKTETAKQELIELLDCYHLW